MATDERVLEYYGAARAPRRTGVGERYVRGRAADPVRPASAIAGEIGYVQYYRY
jgi:hypothetical protein